jgi:aminoglycoside phosphotransferase (APT) family kinase protein
MRVKPWTDRSVERARGEACAALRLPASGAQLMRLSTNALYRLGDLAIRIAPPGTDPATVAREIDFAHTLAACGLPAVAPFAADPLRLPSRAVVSLWHYVDHAPAPLPAKAFGRMLRELHEALDDQPRLPELELKKGLDTRLDWVRQAGLVSRDDVDLLRHRADSALKQLRQVRSALGQGPLHGDARPDNVLVGSLGPVWSDFARVCRGPREWDLIPTALRLERFGLAERDYLLFCDGYGFDVREWEGYDACLAASALGTTLKTLVDYPRHRQEAEARLRYWRRAAMPAQAPAWQAV